MSVVRSLDESQLVFFAEMYRTFGVAQRTPRGVRPKGQAPRNGDPSTAQNPSVKSLPSLRRGLA